MPVETFPPLLHLNIEMLASNKNILHDGSIGSIGSIMMQNNHLSVGIFLNIRRIRLFLTKGGSAGSGPGSCHHTPRILQVAPGRCACMCHPTSAGHPECIQPIQVLPRYAALPHPALATRIRFKTLVLTYRAAILAQPLSTSRTWSYHTPEPVHCTLLQSVN